MPDNPLGMKPPLPEQIARTDRVGIGEDAEHQQDTDDQEADDDGDFDCGEPELELTEVADFRQVHHGEEHHENQGDNPLRDRRHPVIHDRRSPR